MEKKAWNTCTDSRKIWRWHCSSRYLGYGLEWTGSRRIPMRILWWQWKTPRPTNMYAPAELLWQAQSRPRKTNSLLRNLRFWGFSRHGCRIVQNFFVHFSRYIQGTESGAPDSTTIHFSVLSSTERPIPPNRLRHRPDLLCKAWTDRGLVYNAKVRIFSNMLYVRYVHLTKPSIFIKDKPTFSSERMLQCYTRTMTARVQLQIRFWSWFSRAEDISCLKPCATVFGYNIHYTLLINYT
jgi:hypothetical protein